MMSQARRPDQVSRIPYRLHIGVTGHRDLPEAAVAEEVGRTIRRMYGLLPRTASTPVRLAVISPLAEGADRLVARSVLEEPDAILEAVLPLPAADYEAQFAGEGSKQEFQELLARATRVVELPPVTTREEAYEQAGQYVVERCDALIALWDGQPTQQPGDTADIMALARDHGTPIFWINTQPPFNTVDWPGSGMDLAGYRQLDHFNRAALDSVRLAAENAHVVSRLTVQATRADLDPADLQPYVAWLVPLYVRADLLARRAQQRFFRTSDAIFVFAALAVVASAGPDLAAHGTFLARLNLPAPVRLAPLLECVLMSLVLLVIYLTRRLDLHGRWISYRFLAERLRSALFLSMVSGHEPAERSPEPVALHQPTEPWLQRAFDEVWLGRPTGEATVPAEALRRLFARAWLGDQRTYQDRKSRRHARAYRLISMASIAIFGATFCIAALDAATAGEEGVLGATGSTLVLYLAIVLPALAGALGGIGTLREHPRNAHRSSHMAHALARLERRIARAPDLATLRVLARQTEALMLEESGDWFVTMEFRDVEVRS